MWRYHEIRKGRQRNLSHFTGAIKHSPAVWFFLSMRIHRYSAYISITTYLAIFIDWSLFQCNVFLPLPYSNLRQLNQSRWENGAIRRGWRCLPQRSGLTMWPAWTLTWRRRQRVPVLSRRFLWVVLPLLDWKLRKSNIEKHLHLIQK